MSDVLELASVSVVRGAKTLLDKVDWQVNEGERWVILGPNGAGKTTLLQIAAARLHPSSGKAGILDEILGRVDVFELRPRIGLSSAALANQIPEHENVLNVVVTAAYGVTGRWREGYEKDDERRAFAAPERLGDGSAPEPAVRLPVRRRAQARPDCPRPHDRPGTAAPGRARRQAWTSAAARTWSHQLSELARDEDAPATRARHPSP